MKKNCWEHKRCGRQPGGLSVVQMGVCPAAVEENLDDVHEGTNAGRACWVVAGTLCGGSVQGTFGAKYKSCEQCDFYQMVRTEEKGNFKFSSVLLARLRSGAPAAVLTGK
jgi:hypothetical protein